MKKLYSNYQERELSGSKNPKKRTWGVSPPRPRHAKSPSSINHHRSDFIPVEKEIHETNNDIRNAPWHDRYSWDDFSQLKITNFPLSVDEGWIRRQLLISSTGSVIVTMIPDDRVDRRSCLLKFSIQNDLNICLQRCPSVSTGQFSDKFPLVLKYNYHEDEDDIVPSAHQLSLMMRIESMLGEGNHPPPPPAPEHQNMDIASVKYRLINSVTALFYDDLTSSVRNRIFSNLFESVAIRRLRAKVDEKIMTRKRTTRQVEIMAPSHPPLKIAKKEHAVHDDGKKQKIFACYVLTPCITTDAAIEYPIKDSDDDDLKRIIRRKHSFPFALIRRNDPKKIKLVEPTRSMKLVAFAELYKEWGCVNIHPQLAQDLYVDVKIRAEDVNQSQASRYSKNESNEKRNLFKDAVDRKGGNRLLESELADVSRYWDIKQNPRKLEICRSRIHGWGLYAGEDIQKEEIVIEYVGENIRESIADVREINYENRGIGSSYMFRTKGDHIIDATVYGNPARFINHCCQPNCLARIVQVNSEKKILIVSKKLIAQGEEITYDYNFAREEVKIPCLCKAIGCRGTLN